MCLVFIPFQSIKPKMSERNMSKRFKPRSYHDHSIRKSGVFRKIKHAARKLKDMTISAKEKLENLGSSALGKNPIVGQITTEAKESACQHVDRKIIDKMHNVGQILLTKQSEETQTEPKAKITPSAEPTKRKKRKCKGGSKQIKNPVLSKRMKKGIFWDD